MSNIEAETFGLSEKHLEKLIRVFEKNHKILRAIIYGSRAKGNFTSGSDIDITIVAPEMTFSEYLLLLSELEEVDLPQKVDLTKYELLGDDLKDHIRRVGKEIYIRSLSHSEFDNF